MLVVRRHVAPSRSAVLLAEARPVLPQPAMVAQQRMLAAQCGLRIQLEELQSVASWKAVAEAHAWDQRRLLPAWWRKDLECHTAASVAVREPCRSASDPSHWEVAAVHACWKPSWALPQQGMEALQRSLAFPWHAVLPVVAVVDLAVRRGEEEAVADRTYPRRCDN